MAGLLHHPHSLESAASTLDGIEVPNLYELEIRYRKDGKVHLYSRVHIPAELQTDALGSGIKAIHIEPLSAGGLASRLLDGEPDYLVMGVLTEHEQRSGIVLKVLNDARKLQMVCGLCIGALGLGFLPFSTSTLIGGLALVSGTQLFLAGRSIPNVPFFVSAERGWCFPVGK